MAPRRFAPALLVSVALAVAVLARPAGAEQWLTNGGFESGMAGWTVLRGSTATCQAYDGEGAAGVTASPGPMPARVQQEVFAPQAGSLPTGTYTLSGWIKVQSGSVQIDVLLGFTQPNGIPIGVTMERLAPGSIYTHFSVSKAAAFEPDSVVVAFDLRDGTPAEVCFDSIELTTPSSAPSPTPDPTPSATATPTDAATATATQTSPTVPTAVGTSTSTATPTATPTATRTPTPGPSPTSAPSFGFTNGGFEEGLAGWNKYGGELSTTGGARTGGSAGLLTSHTESTKWAYQAVRVEPSRHYEFSAHVLPGNGVREAYLRISWYPTDDASGPALSTSDSLERANGPADAFVFLTTGGVQPPSGAASARLRVMLAPAGAAAASVVIDDVSFAVTDAPTPTPSPSGTPESTGTPAATAPVPLLGAVAATPPAGEALVPPPGFVAEAHGVVEDEDVPVEELPIAIPTVFAETASERLLPRADTPPQERLPERSAVPRDPEDGLPWAWLAGITLVAIGLGGAYVQNRQTPR